MEQIDPGADQPDQFSHVAFDIGRLTALCRIGRGGDAYSKITRCGILFVRRECRAPRIDSGADFLQRLDSALDIIALVQNFF